MIYKIIRLLNFLLLLDFSIFFVLAPYSKKSVKIVLCVAILIGILLIIAGFIKNHQKKDAKGPLSISLGGFLSRNFLSKAVLFFLFVSLCSVINSNNFIYSQSVFFERYVPYLLFFTFGYFLVKLRKNASILLCIFMISVAVLSLGVVVDHFRFPAERILTSFGRTINLTIFLVMAVPLSFVVIIFARNPILKLGGFITAFLSFFSLIWNGSRAAWLAVPMACLGVCFFKSKKLFLISLCVLTIGYHYLPSAYKSRAMTTFEVSSWSRIELYKTAIKIFKVYPFFGAGIGMYEKLLHTERFIPKDSSFEGVVIHRHAHNVYLEILSEMGIIGLGAFLWMFFLFFYKVFLNNSLWNKQQDDKNTILLGLSSTIMATLIFGLASTIIIVGVQDPAVFWFIFGMAASFLNPPNPV